MARPSPDAMTLRDRIAAAVRLNRELVEHVEQSLIPRVHALRKMTRPNPAADDPSSGDKTVHAQAASVLEADHHTAALSETLTTYCDSIRRSAAE